MKLEIENYIKKNRLNKKCYKDSFSNDYFNKGDILYYQVTCNRR